MVSREKIHYVCEGWIEKSVPWDQGLHYSASLVMPNGAPHTDDGALVYHGVQHILFLVVNFFRIFHTKFVTTGFVDVV